VCGAGSAATGAESKGAEALNGQDAAFKEALGGAIYREIGARTLYRKISDAIRNPEGKEKFHRLANDEEGHRKKLESWYLKLFKAKFVADRARLGESETADLKIGDQTGALAAVDLAIRAEMQAEEFYTHQAERAAMPELKALFERLAKEEHGHYEMLEAERNSITGGFYWFDIDSANFLED
jgi:rubrerythrin